MQENKNVQYSCHLVCDYTFTRLADTFIQSDLQYIQAIHFFVSMCSLGIEPTTFCAADAMLYHWATQEHKQIYKQKN